MEGLYVQKMIEELQAQLAEANARAERAEAERERVVDVSTAEVNKWVALYNEAIAAKERAEVERDALRAAIENGEPSPALVGARIVAHDALQIAECTKQERDEALALADARGRALEQIVNEADAEWVDPADTAREALALTAPEALRQQQDQVK